NFREVRAPISGRLLRVSQVLHAHVQTLAEIHLTERLVERDLATPAPPERAQDAEEPDTRLHTPEHRRRRETVAEQQLSKLARANEHAPVVQPRRHAPRPAPVLKQEDHNEPAPPRAVDRIEEISAAGPQDARGFGDDAIEVLDVLEHVTAIDGVE